MLERELPFKTAFEQAPLGMALIHPNGSWLDVNQSFCRITGYTKKELTQLSIRAITYAPDWGSSEKFLLQGKKEPAECPVEIRWIHQKGHLIWVSLTSALVHDSENRILYLVNQIEHITERKQLVSVNLGKEPEFKSLFEQNPDPVFSIDLRGNLTSANEAAARLAECSREELLSRNFASFCEPEDMECLARNFSEAQKGVAFNFEIPITSAKGTRKYLEVTNMPVVVADTILGIYCIAKDITWRKQRREEKHLAHRIGNLFDTEASLEECLYGTLQELCQYAKVPVAEVWISNGRELVLNTQYLDGEHAGLQRKRSKAPVCAELIGLAGAQKRPVFKKAFQEHASCARKPFTWDHQLRSAVAVPLLVQGDVIGVVAFYSNRPGGQAAFPTLKDDFFVQLARSIRRKKAEENLKRFFTISSDWLCVVGFDGYFKRINEAIAGSFGYPPEVVLERPFTEFVHPDDCLWVQGELYRLSSASLHLRFENRYVLPDGTLKWVAWTFTSLVSEELMYGVGRDITEAKKLEKSLRSEKERFSAMFAEAPVTMAILKGKEHVFESANELYYKFSGRTNILGRSVRAVFPEAEGQGIFELMDQTFNTGKSYSVQERLIQLDVKGHGQKENLYLSFMFQPYRNEEGAVEGIFYFGVDVTEQVQARKKIEESQKQYVSLMENLPAAVYTCDAAGRILLYNKAAVSLWGREPGIGKELWCGSLQIFTNDGARLPHNASPMAITLREQRPFQGGEMKIKRPGGTLRHVASFPSPVFDTAGELTGGINVLIDITERKYAEEELNKLSLIARKTINAVIITSPEGRIEWVNDAFTRITGYTFGEVAGKTPAAVLHGPKTDPATVTYMMEKKKRKEPFECELLKYTKSGQPFWVEVQGQLLFDATGKQTHYFDIETDITERKKAYERLMRKEREVRNFAWQLNHLLEEERSRIAREIHDEFGQQLTGLKMSLSSLRNQPLTNARATGILSDMIEGVENTIRSLRRFATELRPGILDALGLAPSMEWLAREFEGRSRIKTRVQISVQQQVFEKDLSIAFFRICQEALTNVSKHARATAVAIEFAQKGKKLSLTVTDNGQGIQSEKLEDPLSMGLIGMRERASLIGGQFKITSTSNKGTVVRLTAAIHE